MAIPCNNTHVHGLGSFAFSAPTVTEIRSITFCILCLDHWHRHQARWGFEQSLLLEGVEVEGWD